MNKYDHKPIEKKWQDKWEEAGVFHASNTDMHKPKYYALVEFPYPSGQGLHVGHPRSYTALDIVARKRRLQAIMSCIRSAGTRLACRRRTMPSRTMCIRPS